MTNIKADRTGEEKVDNKISYQLVCFMSMGKYFSEIAILNASGPGLCLYV